MSLQLLGIPNQLYLTRNNPYTADVNGIINLSTPPPFTDVIDLMNAGCVNIATLSAGLLLGRLSANMNVTTDQPFVMTGWTGINRFRIGKITAVNASTSLTTAVGGVYPAVSKGGTAIVANSQAFSALTTNALALDLTLVTNTTIFAIGTPIYLSLTTPQGAAATCSLYLFGDALD